ncbi:hypothetical protein LRP52_13880 [Photobacterium sp. ZSDE20]|uniref:DUF2799 domain-containing protein n=1 Tax=Photobacterium pectinilyticum TaxID=2906793 RepID=A0ABT1N168_9GAMM|nr:hypothetical protein [Photobacterium sp. ZSDE20]MCQ1058490.1 hypothetical protein [Photobacterium sp. ZSDE20]MDD1823285.1 hypothetical protein [Photobacterium sp. ZSDE20]
MARLLGLCLLGISLTFLGACSSQHEIDLAKNKQWEELGTYHGEQGYRELNEIDLGKRGGFSDVEYEEYRAGYLKGRFDYCAGKKTVGTVINPGYPNDCQDSQSSSSYGLAERGY